MSKLGEDLIKKPEDPELVALQTSSGCFAMMCSMIVMMIVGTIGRGIVLWYSWAWYIVPFGVVQIGFFWALGISFMAGLLCHSNAKPTTVSKKIENDPLGFIMNATLSSAGLNAVALLSAWIIHKFM